MHEHRLGVIAGVVGGGDAVGLELYGQLGEKAVAQGAGGLLDTHLAAPSLGPHVPGAQVEGNGVLLTPGANEPLVPAALLAPELVVKVGGHHGDILPPGEPVEQTHGISSPGDGTEHLGAGGEHMVLPRESLRMGEAVLSILHAAGLRR